MQVLLHCIPYDQYIIEELSSSSNGATVISVFERADYSISPFSTIIYYYIFSINTTYPRKNIVVPS